MKRGGEGEAGRKEEGREGRKKGVGRKGREEGRRKGKRTMGILVINTVIHLLAWEGRRSL